VPAFLYKITFTRSGKVEEIPKDAETKSEKIPKEAETKSEKISESYKGTSVIKEHRDKWQTPNNNEVGFNI